MSKYSFGGSKALAARVKRALENNEKLTFLIGSGLTCPTSSPYQPGVLGVSEIVEDITKYLSKCNALDVLEDEKNRAGGENEYQVAMRTLLICAGQDELNKVIVNAVLNARTNPEKLIKSETIDQNAIESDLDIWHLRRGIDSIAKLILAYRNVFDAPILTTNFDPLLEIAIRRNQGKAHTVFLANDGLFDNVLAKDSIPVVHFHGYWHGSDTLHTNDQITRERPLLKGCLKKILQDNTLLVLGYGGWNDVLTRTLIEVAGEGGNFKNILWSFYSDDDTKILKDNKFIFEGLKSAINQRVVLYKGIDSDQLFYDIFTDQFPSITTKIDEEKEIYYHTESPPITSTWVGRFTEIDALNKSSSKVVFITGIGGQGKSSLASYYIREKIDQTKWDIWDWRDCKEEANRLHTKLISIIERFANGAIRASEIVEESIESLTQIVFKIIDKRKIVFVFDNVDQYVDLENFLPSGPLETLYSQALEKTHNCQFIFTCRPEIRIQHSNVVLLHLEGLNFEETEDLFKKSNINTNDVKTQNLIKDSYELTSGHPLLLNIIIGQTNRDLNTGIKFVSDISTNGNLHTLTLAESILKSVWLSLNAKQQILLRGISEMVRPETEDTLAGIFEAELQSYNQFSKALRALKSLNLVVVRSLINQKDMIDLHPLVKQFVRDKFPKNERRKYITLFVNYYDNLVVILRKQLSPETPLSTFEHWTSKIELEIAKDDYKDALVSLQEIADPILTAGFHEEYLRITSRFFLMVEWRKAIIEEYRYFHEQFREFIHISTHMGRTEVTSFLEQYLSLIPGKSIHYLSYCDLMCYYNWFNGDFDSAMEWGEKGTHLKKTSNIESNFSLDHNLHLAYRDTKKSENVEKALKFFLKDNNIDDLLKFKKPEENIDGTFFGNLGRCYEYLGNIIVAIECYKKSFTFLLLVKSSNSSLNIGYACLWIGDLLNKDLNIQGAYMFYQYALTTWEKTSPLRAQAVKERLLKIKSQENFDIRFKKISDFEIEKFCKKFTEI